MSADPSTGSARAGSVADLHMHTRYSDGTWTPEAVVAEAKRLGLTAISITDHDTVEGCAPAMAACATAGVELITGTELTAEHAGEEFHILGYCVDIHHPGLLKEIARFQEVRQQRVREMVERLNALGVPLKADSVFELANCKAPGRPHVARALVAAGLCVSLDEAFERFLKKNRPAWVPKFKMSSHNAIALIHSAGGAAVLAHPGLNRADDHIPAMAAEGLDGIECFHTKHSASAAQHYLALAARLQLLVTGGSDCHGLNRGKPLIGTVTIPYSRVQELKHRAASRTSGAIAS